MQSERFNQRSPREGRRNRAAGRWGEFHDYSDNQQPLNLEPKRAETPSGLCHLVAVLRRRGESRLSKITRTRIPLYLDAEDRPPLLHRCLTIAFAICGAIPCDRSLAKCPIGVRAS